MEDRDDFFEDLSWKDCICSICMDIMIKPVTMPCNHELCLQCFNANVAETSLTCPFCRMRISVWTRRSTKLNTLINQKRWTQIQKSFPQKVNRRLNGDLNDSFDEIQESTVHTLAGPGEIKQEYEEEIQKWSEERLSRERAETAASMELLKELEYENTLAMKQLEDEKKDLILTQKNNHRKTTKSFTAASCFGTDLLSNPLDGVTSLLTDSSENVSPRSSVSSNPHSSTISSRSNSARMSVPRSSSGQSSASTSRSNSRCSLSLPKRATRSSSRQSQDSISVELAHFEPIKRSPRTPPKSGTTHVPVLRITPINGKVLDYNGSGDYTTNQLLQDRLAEFSKEKFKLVKKNSKSVSTNSAEHSSATASTSAFSTMPQAVLPLEANFEDSLDATSLVPEPLRRLQKTLTATVENDRTLSPMCVTNEFNRSRNSKPIRNIATQEVDKPLRVKSCDRLGMTGKCKSAAPSPIRVRQRRRSQSENSLLRMESKSKSKSSKEDKENDSKMSPPHVEMKSVGKKVSKRTRSSKHTNGSENDIHGKEYSPVPTGKRIKCKNNTMAHPIAFATHDLCKENGLTLEEQDMQLAKQLQADFDMEVKFRLTAIRHKGSAGAYMLRKKRKSSAHKPERCT